MLCALCSIAPEMGITKGRGQNISAAQNKRSCPVSLQKGYKNQRQRFSALASRFYNLTVRKGSAQCFVVSICTEPKSMQNFPNNIVLTSHSYHKYYTMHRCLSMSVRRPAIDGAGR